MIELEVDTREEEGWQESVEFTEGPRFKQTNKERSWADAESHCDDWGGHLVSVHSEWEHQEINRIREKKSPGSSVPKNTIWLGGTNRDEEQLTGAWRWTDGSPWEFRRWQDGIEGVNPGSSKCTGKQSDTFSHGKNPCLSSPTECGYQWRMGLCLTSPSLARVGMCHKTPKKLSGSTTLRLEYNTTNLNKHVKKRNLKKDDLTDQHLALHVWHKYKAAGKHLLDSWEEPRMTGFKLRWYLLDKEGNEKQVPTEAKYKTNNMEKVYHSWLTKMVELARQAREQGKSREDSLQLALRLKMKQDYFLHDFGSKCKRGHLRSENFKTVFSKIIAGLNDDKSKGTPTSEDTMTGFMMFATIIYCPESVIKLYKFIDSVVDRESQRTVLQATLNTILSGDIENTLYERRIDGFYIALERLLKLDFGKILLATISGRKLRTMIDSQMPFFSQYTEEVDQCLNGSNASHFSEKCLGLAAVVGTLGKN